MRTNIKYNYKNTQQAIEMILMMVTKYDLASILDHVSSEESHDAEWFRDAVKHLHESQIANLEVKTTMFSQNLQSGCNGFEIIDLDGEVFKYCTSSIDYGDDTDEINAIHMLWLAYEKGPTYLRKFLKYKEENRNG